MSLAERDFKYTIGLNFEIATRMALYCLKADMKGLNSNSRIMLAITLSWFLASPNRYLRDISTKALVNLLTDNIETMIKLIENFKNAKSAKQQSEILKEINDYRSDVETNMSLANVRFTINTQDPYYKKQKEN